MKSSDVTQKGFTLIELSIVLLIISLITGSIVAGRSLVQSARLTSIADTANQYQTSVRAFELQYHGLPGDITNATEYWPGQTYSGNGDGKITGISQGGTGAADDGGNIEEEGTVFEQLSLANLTSGSYDSSSGDARFPQYAIEGSFFSPRYTSREEGFNCGACTHLRKNLLMFLKNTLPFMVLSPPDAQTLDLKIDDGRPGAGTVTAADFFSNCTDASNYLDMPTARYRLELQTPQCGMLFNLN